MNNAVAGTRKLFTVGEYDQMIKAGIFHEDERLELVAGEIIEMSPINVRHAACVKRLNHFFNQQLGERVIVSVQDPIRLDEFSEPEPDVALIQPRADFYIGGHPEPEDILLLVEVADTSLVYDQTIKIPLYAKGGISEVWLVDLGGRKIETYHQPAFEGYQVVQAYFLEDTLSPQAFPDSLLKVVDILGE